MHPSRFLVAIALAIAFAVPLPAAIELPRENERWTKLELDDYVIYSAARDGITRDVAQRLQLMRDGLAMMTRLNVHPPQRVTVLLFPNDRTFAPYRDAGMGKKMPHISALFGGSGDAGFILIDTDANGGVDRSVFHELTHCFTRNSVDAELPVWFNEGIAEFYSTFQTYGRDKLRVGAPIAEHLMRLQTRGLVPLARLFAVDYNSPDYSEQNRAGDFYAESWLLVHYLMLGNADRAKGLGTFIDLLTNHEPPASAVEKAFGIKEAQLEMELRRYLNQPTMNMREFTPAEKHTYTIVDPAPAPRDTVLLALGTFLAHSASSDDEAPAFYEAALKTNPNNGDVYAAIAALAQHNGDTRRRDAAVAKAVALGTSDPVAYVASGLSYLDSTHDTGQARAMFDKAIALNPRSATAYAGLAAAYSMNHEDEKAIGAYLHSLAIDPQDDVAYDLVTVYARTGKSDLAEKTIAKYITPKGNAALEDKAREALLTLDLNQAIELGEAGKLDEAITLARAAHAAAKSERMKRDAANIETEIAQHQQIAEVNRAIEMANKGKYRDALAVIDAVIPSMTTGDILSKTKTLREQLAAAAAKKK